MTLSAEFVHGRLSGAVLSGVFTNGKNCLFYSAYWFVPNLLVALGLLLVFRPFLNEARTGLIFLLASLFYGVNIYGHWIPVLHTQAVFGFVFYLWLGAWSARHFQLIEEWLSGISTAVLLGLTLFTLMLALAETKLLVALGSMDPVNTLRIGNQLYSLVAVLAIVKVKRSLWPRFVDVREHTFGLYLTHTVALALICSALKRLLSRFNALSWGESNGGALVLIPSVFVLTYLGCLVVVGAFRSNRTLRWTVGLPVRRQEARVRGTFADTISAGVYESAAVDGNSRKWF